MACNSFTSVSLDPPLVMFCAAKSSSTWPRIQAAGKWAANVLGEDDEEVCRLFAEKDADRFAHMAFRPGREWSADPRSTPSRSSTARPIAEHDAGDHVIVVGRVLELGYQSRRQAAALLPRRVRPVRELGRPLGCARARRAHRAGGRRSCLRRSPSWRTGNESSRRWKTSSDARAAPAAAVVVPAVEIGLALALLVVRRTARARRGSPRPCCSSSPSC